MMKTVSVDWNAIKNIVTRNVEDIFDRAHLEKTLSEGKPLRVKHGIDPTGDKIHIGRAVLLWKLREFQDLGHTIVLIIGDFTAQIGDPSDKMEKRPFLTKDQIEANLKNYLPQIGKILDLAKTEVRYNSEWLGKLNFREISELAENFTIQQMIERRNFRERFEKKQEISLRELMYPLMQGYDSVAIKADVELGGTDQLFNLLAGRKIQERYGQKPQDVMTTGMLSGLDGRKMSTSWGNVINIIDDADEQFGKVMSMRDEVMPEYAKLATAWSEEEVKDFTARAKKDPRKAKGTLACAIVARYHGDSAAAKAAVNFENVFAKRDLSGEFPELKLKGSMTAADIVLASKVVKSKSEAWRLVEQGGFAVGEKTVTNPKESVVLTGGEVLRVGKRHYFRVKI